MQLRIPIIDISEPSTNTADELISAAAKYGFVYIKSTGLGLNVDTLDRMFDISRKFFQSPIEEKEDIAIGVNPIKSSRFRIEGGRLGIERSWIQRIKRAFNFGEFMHGKAQQPLSSALVPHETEISHFADICHKVCIKLLRLFAVGLKIDKRDGGEDWFSLRHDQSRGPSGSILRLLFYPAIDPTATSSDNTHSDIRAGAHSDYGSLTLLFQRRSQPGLEILTPQSTWSPVEVNPPGTESDPFPPILVNIGDLLSYWTNGLLKSTVHRVVLPSERKVAGVDRYSIAYFCHPVDETALVPVPSEMVIENGGKIGMVTCEGNKKVLTAVEHLQGRLASTYGWAKQIDPTQD